MKLGLMYANAGPFAFPEMLAHLATTAERVGVESLWTVEHVVIPVGYRSTYPYDPSGKIPAPENMPIPDPFLALAYAAAVTRTLRLATGVVILPQRHPLYVAKEAATLDVLSHGRAILGIGVGWLAEEFEALGIPFAERAARTAETVRAMRSLWKDEPEPFAGRFFRWGPLESHPKPVQKPGVPIVVGGHTEAAARRAARWGDGFFPGVADAATLARLLAVVREECAKAGRRAGALEVTSGRRAADADAVRRLEDLGVARIVVPPPAFDPDGLTRGLEALGDLIATVR
ncbi:MAG TPA: LLM class F420-dependent oxidoreductase [Candidatus Binatia bacterium]|jgi:probable F420-dependent oxidoreductase|nr:LLM class F420-dependent oxidoreductase [Candidatus Binatia bacterium]